MSLVLNKKSNVDSGTLPFPFDVEIIDDRIVNTSRIHSDYELEMFWVRFPIHCVPISLIRVRIIVGMDWLTRFRDLIDYDHQLVGVQTPSGGE